MHSRLARWRCLAVLRNNRLIRRGCSPTSSFVDDPAAFRSNEIVLRTFRDSLHDINRHDVFAPGVENVLHRQRIMVQVNSYDGISFLLASNDWFNNCNTLIAVSSVFRWHTIISKETSIRNIFIRCLEYWIIGNEIFWEQRIFLLVSSNSAQMGIESEELIAVSTRSSKRNDFTVRLMSFACAKILQNVRNLPWNLLRGLFFTRTRREEIDNWTIEIDCSTHRAWGFNWHSTNSLSHFCVTFTLPL